MLVVGSIHTVIYVTTACRYIHGDMEFMLENLCYGMWSLLIYVFLIFYYFHIWFIMDIVVCH